MQSSAIQLMKDQFDALSQHTPDDNVEFWFARMERRVKAEEMKLVRQSGTLLPTKK